MEPEKIDRYQIKALLGRGGMATVYQAYDPRFERDIALKILPQTLLHDPQFRARFEREAKTIAHLEHPAIVPVYDFGEDQGQPFITMRLMPGGTLADRMKAGPLPATDVIRILSRLAPALDAAHSNGIIHRDLKPGNILFDQYGNAYLSDFGIARMTGSSVNLTGSAIIGTPSYMSPEQVHGDRAIDGRSDIYALGVILFQMLTGKMPYEGDTPARVMMMHILEPVPKVTTFDDDLPDELNSVISQAMAKDPDDRYPSAEQMAQALTTASHVHEPITKASMDRMANIETQLVPGDEKTRLAARTDQVTPLLEQPIIREERKPRVRFSSPIAVGLLIVVGAVFIGSIILFSRGSQGPLAFLPGGPSPTIQSTETRLPTEPPTSVVDSTPTDAVGAPVVPTNTPALPTDTPLPPPTATPLPSATATEVPTPLVPIVGGADKLAFIHENDIWVVNLDGSNLEQVTTDGGEKSNLQWSPDSQHIIYIVGKCAQRVAYSTGEVENLACFESAAYFEGFTLSPSGDQVALSVNRELFVLPFNLEALQQARSRSDLQEIGTCEVMNPYAENAVKYAHWSLDGTKLSFVFLGAVSGVRVDLVRVVDITNCGFKPPRLDEFPGERFTLRGYNDVPIIQDFGWDGENLFGLHGYIRNEGYGDFYIYNSATYKGELVNPIGERCCYRDIQWSPDRRYVTFVFQDISLGADSVSEIYIVPFGTIGTGVTYTPIPLPEDMLTNPREKPQPILRPIQD